MANNFLLWVSLNSENMSTVLLKYKSHKHTHTSVLLVY